MSSSVSNLASLATIFGTEGEFVYVQSVKGRFVYTASSAQTADGRTVVNTSLGGTTRWMFDPSFSHSDWRINRNDWYINPSTGNDENNGLTSVTAIKTAQELSRRWGNGNLIKQDGTDPQFAVNVHIRGDILDPDRLDIDVILDGSTELRIIGETITTIRSGTADVSGGITTENQLTNQPWQIKDTVFGGNWTNGQRIKFTSGPANGGVCWVAKNLGSGQARISQASKSSELTFGQVPTNVSPTSGSTYTVEQLPKLNIGHFRVNKHGDSNAFSSLVNFIDLEFQQTYPTFSSDVSSPIIWMYTTFYQCVFNFGIFARGWSFANCLFAEPTGDEPALALINTSYVLGGLALLSKGNSWIEYTGELGGRIDNNTYIQGGFGLCVGQGFLGNIAIFDVLVEGGSGGRNPTGSGLQTGTPGGSNFDFFGGMTKIGGRIWGSGNAGKGIHVGSGSTCSYTTSPTITGTTGDFQLGPGGKARSFNEGTGTYSDIISETWANFNAVQPAGFNGQAHNLSDNCHLVPNG